MTNTKENEEVNKEISSDELKRVSGGLGADITIVSSGGAYKRVNNLKTGAFPVDVNAVVSSGPGSGSGLTKADFERANKRNAIGSDLSDQVMDRNLGAT